MAYGMSAILQNVPTVDPYDFRFRKPFRSSMEVDSYDRILTPELQSYSSKGNRIIKFKIPNDAIFDFTESKISATITLLSDGIPQPGPHFLDPPYVRNAQGIWNLIDRQRHTQDNQKLEERQQAFDISNIEWTFLEDPTYQNFIGTSLLGIGTRAERNARGADPTGTRYTFPVDLGLITSGPFACKYFKECHIIELYINDPLICLESNCGNLEIRFDQLEWIVRCLASSTRCGSDSNAYENALVAYINSGNYAVTYDSWGNFQNGVNQASHDLLIPHRALSLKFVVTVFMNLEDRYNPQADDKLTDYQRHDLIQYQFKINGVPWPEQAVQADAKHDNDYWYYLRWRESWQLNGEVPVAEWRGREDAPTISLEEYKTDSYIIVGDMRHLSDPRVLNNLNTAAYNQDMILQLRFVAAPPPGTAAFHFPCFSSIARIPGNGVTRFCIEE